MIQSLLIHDSIIMIQCGAAPPRPVYQKRGTRRDPNPRRPRNTGKAAGSNWRVARRRPLSKSGEEVPPAPSSAAELQGRHPRGERKKRKGAASSGLNDSAANHHRLCRRSCCAAGNRPSIARPKSQENSPKRIYTHTNTEWGQKGSRPHTRRASRRPDGAG